MARKRRSAVQKRDQVLMQGVIWLIVGLALSAYFSAPLRALLFSVLKALTILAVLAGALWWWWRRSHLQAKPKSILGVELAPARARDGTVRLPTQLDQAWLETGAPDALESPLQFDRALLDRMEWKQLEEVCAEYFRLIGFTARTQAFGADGGIDIWLAAKDKPDETIKIVQCKSLSSPVGIKLMREFLGVMTAEKIEQGVYVSRNGFYSDVAAFAKKNRIVPLSGDELLEAMGVLAPEQQARLLAVATAGEYWRPSCPSCGSKLVKRERGRDGNPFWGCANFPRPCSYRGMPMAE